MDMESANKKQNAGLPSKRRWRRAVVTTSLLGGIVLSGLSIVPSAVMSSSYRDKLLNDHFEKFDLTATSASGSGGWLTAFTFNDVVVVDKTGQIHCMIQSLQLSKSLLSLIADSNDVGTITVVQPLLTVSLNDTEELPLKSLEHDPDAVKRDLVFDVQDAGFVLSVPWRSLPVIDIGHLDITGGISTEADGQWLTVDPIVVFDHEPLSAAHTEQNLALVAPVLSESTELSGEVSVRLEGLRKRLDDDVLLQTSVRGTATFHSVQSRMKKEWAAQVSQLIGRLTGKAVPNRIQIARESTVDFEVNEKGIHHHGLAFLLPDLAASLQMTSSGLVGLDESLDLAIGIKFPQLLPRNSVMAALSKMVRNPLQLTVKGTVSEPKIITPPGMSIVDQLAGNMSGQQQPTPLPSVNGAVMDLIGNTGGTRNSGSADQIAGGILNLIRAAQEAKKDGPSQEEARAARELRRKRRRERRGL